MEHFEQLLREKIKNKFPQGLPSKERLVTFIESLLSSDDDIIELGVPVWQQTLIAYRVTRDIIREQRL